MSLNNYLSKLIGWFDNYSINAEQADDEAIDWLRVIPFVLLHLVCLLVFVVGWSRIAVGMAVFSYLIRMFAITAFYHRYFSHKAFKTSRWCQFLFALLGATATQRGPIWWAAHHRSHHLYSDQVKDIHSPRYGFIWSHMGWFLCLKNFHTQENRVRDLMKFPELRWLDRFDILIPVIYAFMMLGLGRLLEIYRPDLHTNASQMLIWAYFISSVVLIHCTLLVNSLAHVYGSKRYETADDSRNNGLIALLTLGEGWHNNHHHYPLAARQGFFWWELDISYYILKLMEALGLVWDLHKVPPARLHMNRVQKI